MHAYICHSIYLSVPVKVEQALAKAREIHARAQKNARLSCLWMPTTKKKGPRWRLTGNYHQVAEQIILAPYPEIIPCQGSAFPRQRHKLLAVLFGPAYLRRRNFFRDPTTINQTFKSTDKENERQWDKITSVPWEKGGIQRFLQSQLKSLFFTAKKWVRHSKWRTG